MTSFPEIQTLPQKTGEPLRSIQFNSMKEYRSFLTAYFQDNPYSAVTVRYQGKLIKIN